MSVRNQEVDSIQRWIYSGKVSLDRTGGIDVFVWGEVR